MSSRIIKAKKIVAIAMMILLAVTPMSQAQAATTTTMVKKQITAKAAKYSVPIIIVTASEQKGRAYTKISLKLKDNYGIKYYNFNGVRYNGGNKKIINIKNITTKTKNAKVGRNTIYVYNKKGKEGSWAFNLVVAAKVVKSPIIKIREGLNYTVPVVGKDKTYKKISFIFEGEGIIEYGFNGCVEELEGPTKTYAISFVTKKFENCKKGKNTIWIYDEKLNQAASYVFYLE